MGRGKHMDTVVYIYSETMFDALKRAQNLPAVKHDKLPFDIQEITREEYIQGKKENKYIKTLTEMSSIEK